MLVLQVIPVYVAETASKGLRSSMNNVTNISQVNKDATVCLFVCLNAHCTQMNDLVERWPRPPLHVLSPPALATPCCSPARLACRCPRLPPEPS